MFFDDPKNALSVARTHQEALVQREQRDRLGRQAQAAQREESITERTYWWQLRRFIRGWWKVRVPTALVHELPPPAD
jgi:hypothetical protein